MSFLVSVAFFAYYWLLGFALLGVIGRRDDLVRNVLIAPALGLLILVYLLYVPSRAGLPVGAFALPMSLVLIALAVGLLLWRRPSLPGRRGLPYLVLAPLAFAASGWPLFQNGAAWMSQLNPDASNYMLDTQRLVQRSFLDVAPPEIWHAQSDWASAYVLFPLLNVRTGTDLVFAWAVSVTGWDEPSAYMPLILSWHIAALAAATALIGPAYRFARLLSAGLLAVSALSTIGITSQLLGQEMGLGCLALAAVLLLDPFYRLAWPALRRRVALTALVMAGFVLCYPEMLPFLGLAFLIYHGIRIRDLLRCWRKAVVASAVIGLAALLLIAPDGLGLLGFLFTQAAHAGSDLKYAALFPYFLIPSGAAALWGLVSYSQGGGGLLPVDASIILGQILTAVLAATALWLTWRREATAAMVLVMLLLGVVLMAGGIGFGLFKLAMYLQPFMLPLTVLALCRLLRVAR